MSSIGLSANLLLAQSLIRSMTQSLNLFAWLVCVVYSTIPAFWLAIHPYAEFWRSRSRSPYRVLLPLWLLMWIAVGLITAHWREVELYSVRWTWIPAAVLFVVGVLIYRHAGRSFSGRQLGGVPELHPGHGEQQLATKGIRAHVRHPVYLGHLCEMLAWSIGSGLAVCYGLTVFAMVTGAVMIRMEDAELEKRFGEAYRRYRASVPAIVPRLN
jgi:protein-S-isoprenylcysteine O-methyltransferase Ste14